MFICAAMFVGVGSALRSSSDKNFVSKGAFFQVGGAVVVLAALVFFTSMYWQYRNVKKVFADHSYSISEGVVQDFIPMPPGGHSTESFVVSGVRFEYGSGWGSTTFNSEWNKGFIHDGVDTRITYIGKDIIRVEVK
jgi:hypothetical protein